MSEDTQIRLAAVEQRLEEGHGRMDALDRGQVEILRRLDEQDKAQLVQAQNTIAIRTDTADMVATWKAMQGGFIVIEKLAKIAKPLGVLVAFAAGCITLWGLFKAGILGKP